MTDTPDTPPLDAPTDVDPQLQMLVALAERGLSLGITLSVHGMLVTGHLSSAADYFRARGQSLGQAMIAHGFEKMGASWEENNKDLAAQIEKGATTPLTLPIVYAHRHIHIRNVRFLRADGTFVGASTNDVWWRGRLAAVDGFVLGELQATEPY